MKRLAIPLLLFAMTVGVYWKILLTGQYAYFDRPDHTYQVAPWLQVQASEWHKGHILLWDPYIAGGQSLIGQAQPATAYPFNWLLFLMPLDHGFIRTSVLHWYFALIHFIAAWCAYALCRDLGRSRAASVLAASAFAFAGYVGTTSWPQQLHAAVWAPLVFLFSLRAVRGESRFLNTLLSGFFLGLAWLAGHHQIAIFVTLAISGVWIFEIFRTRSRQNVFLYAALIATMFCAGALQILPALSYGRDAVRWASASHELAWNEPVPYSVHREFGFEPYSMVGVIIQGVFAHSDPFVGITVFVLAISAVVLAWSDPAVRLLSALAAGGLVFAFAGNTIFQGILYAVVPFVEKARNPAMGVFIFHLAICTLSAFGVDALLGELGSRWTGRLIVALAAAAALLWFCVLIFSVAKVPLNIGSTTPLAMTALAAAALAGLLYAARSGAIEVRTIAPLLVVLVMFEIGTLPTHDLSNRDQGWKFWSQLTRDRDIADFLKNRPGPFRVEINSDDVAYNFGDWYGIETSFGFVSSLPQNLIRVLFQPATRSLLGIQYYVSKTPMQPGQRELFTSSTGIKVFEVPGAMPRAWSVHQAIGPVDEKVTGAALRDVDLKRSTFMLEQPPPLENCDGDRVVLVKHSVQSSALDVDMNCRGMVILADGYSKDWIATVDGRRAPLYDAYSIVRGVVVESGHHRVEMKYRPVSVYFGALLTGGAMLGVRLICFFRRPRMAPPHHGTSTQ